jgi:hypothetical protein
VRVVFTDDFTDHGGRFAVAAIRVQPELRHR